MSNLCAQKVHKSSESGQTSVGIGLGLSYGALGLKISNNVFTNTSLFAGFGYHVVSLGYNFGVQYSIPTEGQVEVYLNGMYGTNAIVKIIGLPEYDNIYRGPSFGFGIKLNSNQKEGNYWDLGLIIPVTSSEFKQSVEDIENDSRVAEFTKASPVLINIGYNFSFN
ncbi:MAG: hypothetical protein AB8B73_06965 [Ekhidna sp.]